MSPYSYGRRRKAEGPLTHKIGNHIPGTVRPKCAVFKVYMVEVGALG